MDVPPIAAAAGHGGATYAPSGLGPNAVGEGAALVASVAGGIVARREFLSMVSHEFRTPLAALEGTQFLLRQRLKDHADPRIGRHLDAQERCLAVLRDLVDHILVINRLQSGTLAPALRPVRVASFLRDIVDRINAAWERPRVVFTARTDCELDLDEHLFRAAVDNLISNALKFSDEGQRVDLACAQLENGLEVVVMDRGRGIPAEDQKRVFSPFARASNVGSVPGLGLGLTIVRHAMEQHGGSLQLDSVEGVGSCFVLRFPRVPNAGATVAA